MTLLTAVAAINQRIEYIMCETLAKSEVIKETEVNTALRRRSLYSIAI